MSQQRKIVVYAGAEASARAIPLANYFIRFPSYKRSFEIMSNHVLLKSELTGSFNGDRMKIFNALKQGNFYLAMDILGDPKGFVATIDDDKQSYMMGSDIRFKKGMQLTVKLPTTPREYFEIIVFHNGKDIARLNQPEGSVPITEPGVYRVQVRVTAMLPIPDAKKWFTWIYTNPFYVNP